MKFRANLADEALANLGRLYLAASDKRRFSKIANDLERLLEMSPIAAGQQVVGNQRMLVLAPLVVVYDVFFDDRLVEVVAVKSLSPEA